MHCLVQEVASAFLIPSYIRHPNSLLTLTTALLLSLLEASALKVLMCHKIIYPMSEMSSTVRSK